MIKVEWFYWLCGFLFLVTAVVRLRDREDNKRFGSAAFWAIPVSYTHLTLPTSDLV